MTTNLKPGIRGELSRWLIEPKPGVFVGTVSARIREELWDRLLTQEETASGLLLYSARNEQGYVLRTFGDPRRVPVDFDGMTLIRLEA